MEDTGKDPFFRQQPIGVFLIHSADWLVIALALYLVSVYL